MDASYCRRCGDDNLPQSFLCTRPGQVVKDNGPDTELDARYEGICIRCCDHNHG